LPTNATAKVIIHNRLGLHARPAMSFVETASTFNSNVSVCRGNQKVDGKSIMQMMMLAATKGTELLIEVTGDDADDALKALIELVERGFDEE
jgi:phosphocarrier protein